MHDAAKQGRPSGRKSMLIRDWRKGEFLVSTAPDRLDIAAIHRFLALESGWARDIPRSVVEESIRNSLCFGLFHKGKQAGFARVISDYATVAYLGDVFVLREFRGRGLARKRHLDGDGRRPWFVSQIRVHRAFAPGPIHGTSRSLRLSAGDQRGGWGREMIFEAKALLPELGFVECTPYCESLAEGRLFNTPKDQNSRPLD